MKASSSAARDRLARTTSSILWSAWADALGFISELTDEAGLRRRTKGRPLVEPYAWHRQIGGRFGVRALLPEGCYSDDTQLRLATARAVSGHGFDVEAFARVELTAWPAYALGGGRASKAAAAGMGRPNVTWATNFYSGWRDSGGNGAAMRIQPHVYAAHDLGRFDHLDDVIRNAIVTHGHPRAIVGAVLHAVALTDVLHSKRVPGPQEWPALLNVVHLSIESFRRIPELAAFWVPQWEREAGSSFEDAWHATVEECQAMLAQNMHAFHVLTHDGPEPLERRYEALVQALRLDDEKTRGSGTSTTVAALMLAAAIPNDPARVAQVAASRLHTDTDTIGTMAAALVGAAAPTPLPSPLQDANYMGSEATRMLLIAVGEPTPVFPYPDLLTYKPPRSALDTIGIVSERLAVAGLGYFIPTGDPMESQDSAWVWGRTTFGPQIVAKYRRELRPLPHSNWPSDRELLSESSAPRTRTIPQAQPTLFDQEVESNGVSPKAVNAAVLDNPIQWVIAQGFRDEAIGHAFRSLSERGTPEQLEQFASKLSGLLRARSKRG